MRFSWILRNESLGPFQPRKAIGKLPKVNNIPPQEIGLPAHPRYRYPAQSLLRAIDIEQRMRQENEHTQFILSGNVKPGSVVLVDQVNSRVSGQTKSFAGVLLGIRKRGILSSMVLKSKVMGIVVEQRIPIYSPLVTNITVLKDSPLPAMDTAYWLREKDHPDINYEEIEHMVIKHKNQEARKRESQ